MARKKVSKKVTKQKQSQKQSVTVNISQSSKRRVSRRSSSVPRAPQIIEVPRFFNTYSQGQSESIQFGRSLEDLSRKMDLMTLAAARQGAQTTQEMLRHLPPDPKPVRVEIQEAEGEAQSQSQAQGSQPVMPIHGSVDRPYCPICGPSKNFASRTNLNTHMEKYHPGSSSFQN